MVTSCLVPLEADLIMQFPCFTCTSLAGKGVFVKALMQRRYPACRW